MRLNFKYLLIIFLAVSVVSCKKLYSPPAITSPGTYLVVEGTLSGAGDGTTIKLSRTVNLADSISSTPELNALVSVQSDHNENFQLSETSNGNYVIYNLTLNALNKYKLVIKTADNKQYYSDYVPVLNSPPIDSVYYKINENGITIKSATHDLTNTVKYYRWDYQETWVIHSNYDSFFYTDRIGIFPRPINGLVNICWQSDTSSAIVLGSTARLAQAVLTNNPITSITSTSEKLGSKYSILVRQYALTADAYTFWTNLKKNTEQFGGIFDAQPSQINGNIHSLTNPGEPVIGYFSAGTIASKRIFIANRELPAWSTIKAYPNCVLDTFYYKYAVPPRYKDTINQVYLYLIKGSEIPVQAIVVPGRLTPLGYTASSAECVDCTLRGTNKQPAFWEP